MPKFTVHFMTAYQTWEGVEAKNEEDAISNCETPIEFDGNDPSTWVAHEEEGDKAKCLDCLEFKQFREDDGEYGYCCVYGNCARADDPECKAFEAR